MLRFPKVYPRYDLLYKEKIKVVYDTLQGIPNLLLTGRVGFYNYSNFDHCLDMGKFISEQLVNGQTAREVWSELEERVASYRIVD